MEKDAFYQALNNLYYSLRPTQLTVILGDFNAVSGTDRNPCQRVTDLELVMITLKDS